MAVGVITDNVPFFVHPPDQIRVFFDKCTDYKKCGRGVMFFQSIQNRGSIAIFISGIEGQVNDRIGGIRNVVGLE